MNASTERTALGLSRLKGRKDHRTLKDSSDDGNGRPAPRTELVKRIGNQADSLSPRMPTDFESESLGFFFENYQIPGNESRPGYLDSLPELALQARDAPYFLDALLAVSKAAMASRFHLVYLLSASRRHFGSALRNLQKALEDPETAKSDHVFATSLLCSKYEVS